MKKRGVAFSILAAKHLESSIFGRPRRRREINIKMDLGNEDVSIEGESGSESVAMMYGDNDDVEPSDSASRFSWRWGMELFRLMQLSLFYKFPCLLVDLRSASIHNTEYIHFNTRHHIYFANMVVRGCVQKFPD
jgi:hypothetical protein